MTSTGSIVCPNCAAQSDEPCAVWCAAGDPNHVKRGRKLTKAVAKLTAPSCPVCESRLIGQLCENCDFQTTWTPPMIERYRRELALGGRK